MNFPNINTAFVRWATAEFSGMWGNPKSKLWICGIEFGGSEDDSFKFEINKDYAFLNEDGKLIPCWNDNFKRDNKYKTWQYDRKVAKFACHYYSKKSDYTEYMDYLYAESGDTFKMNLYPISFQDSSDHHWDKKYYNKTGLANKQMYRVWCMINRFPSLKHLVKQNSPKAIICTGKDTREDFLLAFRDKNDLFNGPDMKLDEKDVRDKKLIDTEFYRINDDKTILVITRFFGQGGIMSDNGLDELAALVKKYI